MVEVIGSISEQGWVLDSKRRLASIISYYILSDAAQSVLFQGNIINLPETYYKFINDPAQLALNVQSDLNKLLSRYFSSVDIMVEAKELTAKKYAILLYAEVTDSDNNNINLAKIVQINSEGLRRVIDVNNYGTGSSILSSL